MGHPYSLDLPDRAAPPSAVHAITVTLELHTFGAENARRFQSHWEHIAIIYSADVAGARKLMSVNNQWKITV
jgi:hypothetical protein